ncbi:hypothetical protein Tco_0565388 [Tanacetum coccineum]
MQLRIATCRGLRAYLDIRQFDLCLGKELAGNVGAVDESSLNLTTTLNWLRLEAIEGCDQKPLEAAITKLDVQIWRLRHDLKGERNLCKELDDEGYHCGIWYMFGTEGRFEASGSFETSRSFVDRLSISVTDLAMVEMSKLRENQTWFLGQVTNRKSKVKRWMFKGVKAFSHVNFDEYCHTPTMAETRGVAKD